MSAIDTIANNTNAAASATAKAKTAKVGSDGVIYYIVPNANSLLKSGYIYCNYLMDNNANNESITNIRDKLMSIYSTCGNEIDIMIAKCADTENVFGTFLNNYCLAYGKTHEEIEQQIKDNKKIMNDGEKDIEIEDKIFYHNNVFKAKQTDLKETLIEASTTCGYMLKFVKYADMFAVGVADKVIKKGTKKPAPKKENKETVKSKDVKLESPKKDDKKEEDKKDDKKDEKEDEKPKSKVIRKPKPEEKKDDEKKVETKTEAKSVKLNKKKDEVIEEDDDDDIIEKKPTKKMPPKKTPKKEEVIEEDDDDFDAPAKTAPKN